MSDETKPERLLPRILRGRRWEMLRMSMEVARKNREKINSEWCIVCGHAAVEDHPARFHAAGGALAGPFCSGRCAWHWFRDDRISSGDYPPPTVREVYREGTDHVEFERWSASEAMVGATIFPRGGQR